MTVFDHSSAATLTPPSSDTTVRLPTAANRLLRAAVFLHALALFAIVFTARQTHFGNLLFLTIFDGRVDDPYRAAVLVERVTVSLYLLLGAIALFRPSWPVLMLMFAYAFLEAWSGMHNGEKYSELSLGEQALRWGSPLALLMLTALPKATRINRWRATLTSTWLRLAVAVVFITHGFKALEAYPPFIDLIIGTVAQVREQRLAESLVVSILKVIGTVDIAAAIALVLLPTPILTPAKWWPRFTSSGVIPRVLVPALLVWLATWGLVTAMSRMTALGWPTGLTAYTDVLVRSSHCLAPLAIWMIDAAVKNRGEDR